MPVLPQARQRHHASVRQRNRVRLLAGSGFFPFVEAIDRHEAAAALACVAEGRPGLDPFRLGVDVGEADVQILGPAGDKAPAQKVQTALSGLGRNKPRQRTLARISELEGELWPDDG